MMIATIVFAVVLALHGLIHLLGFVKAYWPDVVTGIHVPITRSTGRLWLLCTLLFFSALICVAFSVSLWWAPAFIGALLSQILIFLSWKSTRFGTILNVVVLLAAIIGFSTWRFERSWEQDVTDALRQTESTALITEADIVQLPAPVQKYLRYTGCINAPRIESFCVKFEGAIRADAASEWMPFTSTQFNVMKDATRLFFMNATMNLLPVAGYHRMRHGEAVMDIRLLSLIRVQYQTGPKMDTAETVTFFNDMCLLAPGTLIDKRIRWDSVIGNKVKAYFTQSGITVSAWLHFNDAGELIDFVSSDRYATMKDGTLQKLEWSTPVQAYRMINGKRLAGDAQAIYKYPTENLIYGTFHLTDIQYNNDHSWHGS